MDEGKTSVQTEWREAVSSHVERYRERRRKFNSNLCLQLDFDAQRRANRTLRSNSLRESEAPEIEIPGIEIMEAPVAAAAEEPTEPAAQFSHIQQPPYVPDQPIAQAELTQPAPAEVPAADAPATPRRTRKIIEFPRLIGGQRSYREELAEPVLDAPRIVEAPIPQQMEMQCELLPLVPAITLDEPQPADFVDQEPESPIQVASLVRRALSAAIDVVVILVALAAFGYVFSRLAHILPALRSRAAALAVAAIVGMVWAAYQYAFLVYGAATVGMRLTRLQLRGFKYWRVSRSGRRRRALGMMLSFAAAGLGVWWALLDEDTLCWHDRISRTYLAER
jgi:hypothetical protein